MAHAVCIETLQALRGMGHTMAYNPSWLFIAATNRLTVSIQSPYHHSPEKSYYLPPTHHPPCHESLAVPLAILMPPAYSWLGVNMCLLFLASHGFKAQPELT